MKGHTVVVFEARVRPFERFHEGTAPILPGAAIEADLASLAVTGIDLRCNTRIDLGRGGRGLSGLTEAFDAVYLGVGRQQFDGALFDLDSAGRIAIAPVTYATSHPKVFAGGSQRYQPEPFSPITSLQDGRYAGPSAACFRGRRCRPVGRTRVPIRRACTRTRMASRPLRRSSRPDSRTDIRMTRRCRKPSAVILVRAWNA